MTLPIGGAVSGNLLDINPSWKSLRRRLLTEMEIPNLEEHCGDNHQTKTDEIGISEASMLLG
jgi:hypothetical protein